MNENLEQLIGLQEKDKTIDFSKRKIKEIPRLMEALDAEKKSYDDELSRGNNELAECDQRRKRLEQDLLELQDKESRYKKQLMEVKTNKEYQALLAEIDAVESLISETETNIIEELELFDKLGADLKEAEKRLADKGNEIAKRREELAGELSKRKEELVKLEEERKDIVAKVPSDLFSTYERLRAARGGIAVVEVKDGVCQGCFVGLTPQDYAELRSMDKIIFCANCNRILYYLGERKTLPDEDLELFDEFE
jgi:predicted  nucleic acid-binding Zn-ribbon protein